MNSESTGHVFKLDRNRRLRFTQRTKYRMSNSGLTASELSQGTRSFANVCHFLYALIDEPNPDITAEDIAAAIEGREEKAAEMVTKCFTEAGIIKEGEEDEEDESDPKSNGPTDSPSQESTSD